MNNANITFMPYKIWYQELDTNGNPISIGVRNKEYKNIANALKAAEKIFGGSTKFKYQVARRNPWYEYFHEETCEICGAKYNRPESVNGYDRGHELYLSDQFATKSRKTIRKEMCPTCYGEIKNLIEKLGGKEHGGN